MLFFIDVFFELWIYIVVCTFRVINHFWIYEPILAYFHLNPKEQILAIPIYFFHLFMFLSK